MLTIGGTDRTSVMGSGIIPSLNGIFRPFSGTTTFAFYQTGLLIDLGSDALIYFFYNYRRNTMTDSTLEEALYFGGSWEGLNWATWDEIRMGIFLCLHHFAIITTAPAKTTFGSPYAFCFLMEIYYFCEIVYFIRRSYLCLLFSFTTASSMRMKLRQS